MPDKRQTIGAAQILGISLWLIGILVTAVSAQKNDQSPKGATVVITTRHGEQHTGTLLFASDSALVLYNLQSPQVPAKIVLAAEIDRAKIVRKSHFWTGVVAGAGFGAFFVSSEVPVLVLGLSGALYGGAIDALLGFDEHITIAGNVAAYEAFLPKLRKIAAYPKLPQLPLPELYALMQSSTQPTSSAFPAASTIAKPDSASAPSVTMAQPAKTKRPAFRLPAAKLHISIATGSSSRLHNDDILDAFGASGIGDIYSSYSHTDTDLGGGSLSAEYNLSSQVCLGLALHEKMPRLGVYGKDYEFENVVGASYNYNLFVKYVPRPAAPLFLSHLEVALGAGLSYSMVRIEGSLTSRTFIPTFAMTRNVIGGYLQWSTDYYITKSLSLQYKFSGRLMPAVQVPEISERTVQGVTKTLKPHALHLTTFESFLGVGLHF